MRALKVVDVETTGFHAEAEVIELGWVELWECQPRVWTHASYRFDSEPFRPRLGVPPQARAVHHISAEELQGERTWAEAGAEALSGRAWRGELEPFPLVGFVAHQAEYERRWLEPLTAGLPWLCTYKCALRAWPDAPSHGVFALLYWLEDQGKLPGLRAAMTPQHKLAHRAGPDAWATAWLAGELLREHALEELFRWSEEPRWIQKVPFGEHRGKRWEEVDTGLLEWVLKKDFEADVKAAAMRELERRMAARDKAEAGPGPLFEGGSNA